MKRANLILVSRMWHKWLYKCSKFYPGFFAIIFFVLFVDGCATRYYSQMYIGPGLVEFSSPQGIEKTFALLFKQYSYSSNRFSIKEVSAGKAHYCFVTAFPYKGPAMFCVYGYEQIRPEVWRLRAYIPVVQGPIEISFNVVADDVNVMRNGAVLFKMNCMAAELR